MDAIEKAYAETIAQVPTAGENGVSLIKDKLELLEGESRKLALATD